MLFKYSDAVGYNTKQDVHLANNVNINKISIAVFLILYTPTCTLAYFNIVDGWLRLICMATSKLLCLAFIIYMGFKFLQLRKLKNIPLLEFASVSELKSLLNDKNYKFIHPSIYRILCVAALNDVESELLIIQNGRLKGKTIGEVKKTIDQNNNFKLSQTEVREITKSFVSESKNNSKTLIKTFLK